MLESGPFIRKDELFWYTAVPKGLKPYMDNSYVNPDMIRIPKSWIFWYVYVIDINIWCISDYPYLISNLRKKLLSAFAIRNICLYLIQFHPGFETEMFHFQKDW